MKTTDHRAELEMLMAYLDGELSGGEMERVRAHVAECGECQQVEEEMRGVSTRLQTWEVEGAPSSLSAPVPRGGSLRRWLPLAASLVLATGAGLAWLEIASRSAPSTQVAALRPGEPVPEEGELASARTALTAQGQVSRRSVVQVGGGPLLARTARLTIVTDQFDTKRAELDALIRRLEGFTGRILVTGTVEQGRALSAILQIPSDRLDEAIVGLKALGRVSSEGMDGEDVTLQSVDLDARLANARNSEKRLTAVLANRTGDLDDVLAVEREIARVRGEIESMEAQRKALDRRVTYATVDLQLTEEKRAAMDLGPQPLSTRFVDAFVEGWNDVLGAAVELGLVLARLTPLMVVLLLLGGPVVLLRRRVG